MSYASSSCFIFVYSSFVIDSSPGRERGVVDEREGEEGEGEREGRGGEGRGGEEGGRRQ